MNEKQEPHWRLLSFDKFLEKCLTSFLENGTIECVMADADIV